MTDARKWCWRVPDDETAAGPFDSRELALDDARYTLTERDSPLGVVMLGRCEYPDPEKHILVYLDVLLERADEIATDDDFYADDSLFEINGDAAHAQRELDKVIAAWARQWVRATQWTIRDEEEIEL